MISKGDEDWLQNNTKSGKIIQNPLIACGYRMYNKITV